MAARLNPLHDTTTREKIRTSQLINRLQAFALSETEPKGGKPVKMSKEQVSAALGLLRKTLPDLAVTQLQGDPNNPLGFVIYGEREKASVDEWTQENSPPE